MKNQSTNAAALPSMSMLFNGPSAPKATSWYITKDHLQIVSGHERSATPDQIGTLQKAGFIHEFRLYDKDGALCYEGLSNDPYNMSPLHDFGQKGNNMCTAIWYKDVIDGEFYAL